MYIIKYNFKIIVYCDGIYEQQLNYPIWQSVVIMNTMTIKFNVDTYVYVYNVLFFDIVCIVLTGISFSTTFSIVDMYQ